MRDRKNLTKSLHTVSAVSRLALHLRGNSTESHRAPYWVDAALSVLGQPTSDNWPSDDPTIAACIAAVQKATGGK